MQVGLKREANKDKFYTSSLIVEECMKAIETHYVLQEFQLIEPSAGDGAFVKYFEQKNYPFRAFDVEPHYPSIERQDFLTLDVTPYKEKKERTIVIGNPPFGRQSSLAKKFIKKSVELSHHICFILPLSFKKESNQRTFDSHYHLVHSHDLQKNAFLVDSQIYHVPCVFQIWQYSPVSHRETAQRQEPYLYTFLSKNKKAKEREEEKTEEIISIRRVGVNAGHASRVIFNKSAESHYFIRLFIETNKIDTVVKRLLLEKYEINTVGPRSISKLELIPRLNTIIHSLEKN